MNSRDNDRQKFFTRRAALLAGGQFGLLTALVGRMYYLQVVESKRYQTLAEENRINTRLIPPSRGRILDRFGVPVAVNQQNYRVLIKSENTPDVPRSWTWMRSSPSPACWTSRMKSSRPSRVVTSRRTVRFS